MGLTKTELQQVERGLLDSLRGTCITPNDPPRRAYHYTTVEGRPPLSIEVKQKDQNELINLLSGGVQQVRVVLRALALLQLAKGASAPRISGVVPLTPQAIRKVGHRYQEGGLEPALYDKQRPGAAAVLEDSQKQRIIAMVCSDPPEGRARWTVRLVA
jgi:putative transposase